MARLKRLLMAGVAFLALSTPAYADPGSLIVSIVASSAFAATTVGTAIAGIINIGLAVGLNYLTAEKPQAPKPQEIQNVIRQSIPVRSRHYGRRKLGGALLFIEARDGSVYQVVAFGSHRFDAIEEWVIDNRHVTLDAQGFVSSSPYPGEKVRIQSRIGSNSQTAYQALIDKFPTIWTAAHQANGIMHAMLETRDVSMEDFSKTYPNRIAVLNAICRAARVYDPRTGTTAYTANLPLQLRDYLRHADGLQISANYIDEADFITAANRADDILPTKAGGTVRRYHGALSYRFDAEPKSVIERFIVSTDGRLYLKPSGKIGFSVGVWEEPTVELNDDHIIDFSLRDGAGPLRESNEIIVKYEEPLADFAEAAAQPWRQEDEISEYGETRSKTVEAYEIQNHNHARRIAKLIAHRAAPRWQGTLRTTLAGMRAWDQRFIRVRIADLDTDDEPFLETMEVISIGLNTEDMTVNIMVASLGPEAYAFDPATEEGTAPALPERVEEGALPDVDMATAIGTQRTVSGGVKVALIKASVAPPGDRDDLQLQVQYSKADAENWQSAAVADGAYSVDIVGLEDGALYDVRMRWRGSSGSVSTWAVIENVAASADPTAPAVPKSLSVSAGSAPATARIAWKNPNSANFAAARVYRGTTNNASAAVVIDTVYGAASASADSETGELASGTHYFWVTAANGSGVESARTFAGSLVV